MTWTLRILLIAASLMASVGVIGRIRKAKMQIEDAVFWVLFSLLLLLLSLCPPLLFFFTNLLGMQSPANLLFLVIIALLLLKIFSMSVKLSLLEGRIAELTENIALKERFAEEEHSGCQAEESREGAEE